MYIIIFRCLIIRRLSFPSLWLKSYGYSSWSGWSMTRWCLVGRHLSWRFCLWIMFYCKTPRRRRFYFVYSFLMVTIKKIWYTFSPARITKVVFGHQFLQMHGSGFICSERYYGKWLICVVQIFSVFPLLQLSGMEFLCLFRSSFLFWNLLIVVSFN